MQVQHSCFKKAVFICQNNVASTLRWRDPLTVLKEQVAQCSSYEFLHRSKTSEHFPHSWNSEIGRKATSAVEIYINSSPDISVSWKKTENDRVQSHPGEISIIYDCSRDTRWPKFLRSPNFNLTISYANQTRFKVIEKSSRQSTASNSPLAKTRFKADRQFMTPLTKTYISRRLHIRCGRLPWRRNVDASHVIDRWEAFDMPELLKSLRSRIFKSKPRYSISTERATFLLRRCLVHLHRVSV